MSAAKTERKPRRFCACKCGREITEMSEQAIYAPGHRQRAYARRRGKKVREALEAVEGRDGVKTTPTRTHRRRETHRGTRQPTRYTVAKITSRDPLAFEVVDEVQANRKDQALKSAEVDPETHFAFPARDLPT